MGDSGFLDLRGARTSSGMHILTLQGPNVVGLFLVSFRVPMTMIRSGISRDAGVSRA